MAEQKNSVGTSPQKVHPASDVATNDIVRLRKPHPCGSFDWRVVRIGADIGLRCQKCERRVTLNRTEFERRFKQYLARAAGNDTEKKPE